MTKTKRTLLKIGDPVIITGTVSFGYNLTQEEFDRRGKELEQTIPGRDIWSKEIYDEIKKPRTGQLRALTENKFDATYLGYIVGATYRQTGTYQGARSWMSMDGPDYEPAYLENPVTHLCYWVRRHIRGIQLLCLESQVRLRG